MNFIYKDQSLICSRDCDQQAVVSAVLSRLRDLLHWEHSQEECSVLEDFEILEPFKDGTTFLCADQCPTWSGLGPLLAQAWYLPHRHGWSATTK